MHRVANMISFQLCCGLQYRGSSIGKVSIHLTFSLQMKDYVKSTECEKSVNRKTVRKPVWYYTITCTSVRSIQYSRRCTPVVP